MLRFLKLRKGQAKGNPFNGLPSCGSFQRIRSLILRRKHLWGEEHFRTSSVGTDWLLNVLEQVDDVPKTCDLV